jgi:putative membrane protein
MNDKLQPRMDFPHQVHSQHVTSVQATQIFEDQTQSFKLDETLTENADAEASAEQLLTQVFKPRRTLWGGIARLATGVFALSLAGQVAQWFYQAWARQDLPALAACVAASLIGVAAIGAIVTEWRHMRRLKQRAVLRQEAQQLLQGDQMEQGVVFCEKLLTQSQLTAQHPAIVRWRASLHESQRAQDVVTLYAHHIQPLFDIQARRAISQSAAESALIIAVSPLALVDMAFIAWRNLRLINRIAALYGIELGYFSRIKLFRMVLLNIAFAGVSEWVREVGVDWLSQDLAARVSARAAQGIGAGLLTARLGIKTMELCRTLPWIDGDKPKLGDFRHELTEKLKNGLHKNA